MSALQTTDPDVWSLLEAETQRQKDCLELIASENHVSEAVLEALGSRFTNKYAEGLPGKRYYGGAEVVDALERLCQSRALAAFGVSAETWDCNVQAYSGSVANMAVYLGLLQPGDRIMGLDLPSGGHLSHGYTTPRGKKITGASMVYESIPYKVGADGWLDYEAIAAQVLEVRPRLLICGASAYARDWDYSRFRAMADSVGAYLMADIAHISGFVATGLLRSPFDVCDVVTTTTHKTLRGPRSALIFFRRTLGGRIHEGVFPGLQGGPHMHQIAAVAVQLAEVMGPAFRTYMAQVHANAVALGRCLQEKGYRLVTGGTDNHLLLVDVTPLGLDGAKAERALERAGISVNKNTIPGDVSALRPSGIRLGTPTVTTRGLGEADMTWIAERIHTALTLAATSMDTEDTMRALRDEVRSFCATRCAR